MIQLSILTGRKAGTQVIARRLPLALGRAAGSGCLLDDDGIWDRHAELELCDTVIKMTAGAGCSVTINGERVQEAVLRNGDLLELASVKVRFGLSPTQQRNLWFREALTWVALAAVSLGQVALIYLLAD